MKKSKLINKRLDELTISVQRLTDKINGAYHNQEPFKSIEDSRHHILLVDASEEFYRYLIDYNVRSYERRQRSRKYISRIVLAIKLLKEEIINHGRDITKFKVSDINEDVVGWYFEALEKSNFARRTFNDVRANINTFEIWLLEKGYLSKRYFIKIKKKSISNNPKAITQEEFDALIKLILKEPGKYRKLEDIRHRDHYQPWLANGLQIALEIGGRMDDIMNLRYYNIIEEFDKPVFIKIEDFKYNVQRKLSDSDEKKYKSLPITKNLLAILKESGYEKKKGSDEFIFLPEITSLRLRNEVIPRVLTTGFAYYYKKLNTGRHLTFKSIRKADITSKFLHSGGHPEYLSGHSSNIIATQHYVDKDEIAKYHTQMGYSVFPEPETRLFFEKASKAKKETILEHPKRVDTSRITTVKVLDRDVDAILHEKSKKSIFSENDQLIGIIQGNHPVIVLKH